MNQTWTKMDQWWGWGLFIWFVIIWFFWGIRSWWKHRNLFIPGIKVVGSTVRHSKTGQMVPMSSGIDCPSFTGVVLSDDEEPAFPQVGLWLLSCELVGSVKASCVELESESITTSLSWLRSAENTQTSSVVLPVTQKDIKIYGFCGKYIEMCWFYWAVGLYYDFNKTRECTQDAVWVIPSCCWWRDSKCQTFSAVMRKGKIQLWNQNNTRETKSH